MNDKLGKSGVWEVTCLCAISACVSGIFAPDSAALYAKGNSAYVSTLLSVFFALAVFMFASHAMRLTGTQSYFELLSSGFGRVFSRIFAILTAIMLIVSTYSILDKFLFMLSRFVFPGADPKVILLYMLAGAFFLAWLGLEGLSRTAKIIMYVSAFALLGALILAFGNYEAYRLAPYLGDGSLDLLNNSVKGTYLFLPALTSLLIVVRGVHGVKFAKKAGLIAGSASGIVAAACQVCIGMTYPYNDLAVMRAPMYSLSMDFKLSAYFPELNTILFFGWLLSAVIACAFYIYAASLLYMEVFAQSDVRPAIAAFSVFAGALTLISREISVEAVLYAVKSWGSILLALPAIFSAALARVRVAYRRKEAERE